MKLEQRLYKPIQESNEDLRVYQVGDLESLSASALYYGAVGSGGGTLRPIGKIGKFGMVKTPLMKPSVGDSSYFTVIPTIAPKMDLEVLTPSSYYSVSAQKPVLTSPSSFSYINPSGQSLGNIENLNPSEMRLLIKKHFDLEFFEDKYKIE